METLNSGLKWTEVIDSLNKSKVLEAKIVEREIRKKANFREDTHETGNTLFIKRKDSNYKTVYRKNIKEDKENFLNKIVNANIIDYLNANLLS